jgi:hypothetical protein
MRHRPIVVGVSVLTALVLGAAPASAQTGTGRLISVFRTIFGPNGLVVNSEQVLPDGSTHSAHFNSAFQSEFTQFNVALASQLTAVPLPSPASGFTYTFDAATGTFVRSTRSFGPIFADRAETIGKGRLSFGYNYQYFSFDSLEGIDLSGVPAVFTHDDFLLGGGRADVVTTINAVEASVGQWTGSITYGLTERVDVSLAVPVIRTRLVVISNATMRRIGTEDRAIHFFRDPDARDGYGDNRQFRAGGTATGIGDLIARVKVTAAQRPVVHLALGLDTRLPTGDERDLLGAGALGLKPFAALSMQRGRIAPHVNVAYQWNGESILAGDLDTGSKDDLPDQFLYTAGADVGVNDRFSLAFDLLGQWIIDSPRLIARQFSPPAGPSGLVFPDIGFVVESFPTLTGAAGFKANVAGGLLINFNLRFKISDTGLRDRVTPLIGFEYGF